MSELIALIATAAAAAVSTGAGLWPIIHRFQRREAAATWQAQHDPLTRLRNRAGLTAWLRNRRERHPDQALVVAMLDVDDLKAVNDTHGHAAGDQLLTVIACRLDHAATLHGGVAARLSGDEFAVLIPYDHGAIGRLIDGVVAIASAATTLEVDDTLVDVHADLSAGTSWGEPADPLAMLLRRADVALYHAKHGEGRHVLYRPDLTMPRRRPATGARLRDTRPTRGGDR